jgi:hypothetical protein
MGYQSMKRPKIIIKTFILADFFHLPVMHLELQMSPRIFEKN